MADTVQFSGFYAANDQRITSFDIGDSFEIHLTNNQNETVTGSDSKEYYYYDIDGITWYDNNGNTYNNMYVASSNGGYLRFGCDVYVQDADGQFWQVNYGIGISLQSYASTVNLSDAYNLGLEKIILNGSKYYGSRLYSTGNYRYDVLSNTIPEYFANGTMIYIVPYYQLASGYQYDGTNFTMINKNLYSVNRKTASKVSTYACSRKYVIPSYSISYPSFTCSKYAKVTFPKVVNTYKAQFYKSTNNGASWTLLDTKSMASSITTTSNHTFTTFSPAGDDNASQVQTTARFAVSPSVTATTLTVSDNTVSTRYRAIYYGASSNSKTVDGTYNMEILDLTMPTNPIITGIADWSNRTPETFSIAKTTITDLSRISFVENFPLTSLPMTSQQAQAGKTSYQIQGLDANGSLTTNLGEYLYLPNENYEYRIGPKLDGSTSYKSSLNNSYERFYFQKATTKLDMTRGIEMGSIMPKKINLLVNPIKTQFPAGSTVQFFVANNGNDANIIWEELPYDCIGSASEPKVNSLEFSNTTKTAATWKVMIRIVADKGTATTDFYLKTLTAVINGGADNKASGFTALTSVVLDASATTVNIEVPEGYTKYKLIGKVINSNKGGNPYVRVNGLSSGYDTYYSYYGNGTLSKSTVTNHAGTPVYTSAGLCPMFEVNIFSYNNKYYINSHGEGDLGFGSAHSMITLSSGLSSISLVASSTSYPMLAGSEFTLLGVENG